MKKLILKLAARIYLFCKNAYQSKVYEGFREKYDIHPSFKFNGDNIIFYGAGTITIGKNCYAGWFTTMQAVSGTSICVGDNCAISHNVKFYTSSNITNQNFDINQPKIKSAKSISVGNGVWIGANVFINPGVKIGNNVVIGANSVVTKDIEDYCVVGGVPAQIIKKINV